MKKAVVFLANGFEEIEALTAVDVLRRAGAVVDIVSVCEKEVTGAHGIKVIADITEEEFNPDDYDAVVLPGGMPGAKILGECKKVVGCAATFDARHKIVAAICAAPATVLGMNGLTEGRRVTCYPADQFVRVLEGATYTGEELTVDGNLITANGPTAAMQFALAICEKLGLNPSL